ncbi:hypothetical protein [Polycladomyces zharkentensis]|uniref:hypothetical protein n=1 Tax=Polycladomyces zharkentensis TaxID=2807616 RepID=UPI001967B82A|nr:hypothetical protein [Polycladomyces sp. WAk]
MKNRTFAIPFQCGYFFEAVPANKRRWKMNVPLGAIKLRITSSHLHKIEEDFMSLTVGALSPPFAHIHAGFDPQ